MEKVIIIVPIYKKILNYYEKISLQQLFTVLGEFPITLVGPEGFQPDYTDLFGRKYLISYFPKEYFESTESYSRLLLSEEFYDRFCCYEYMLIYQLDSFVFHNRLLSFCDMGYDYIGATIYKKSGFWSMYHMGNGGLSLRRIENCRRVLKYVKEFQNNVTLSTHEKNTEDVFFSYCCKKAEYNFSGAPIEVADAFSLFVDTEEKKKKVLEKGLPFGIHYFPTYYYDFWSPFIRLLGYQIPASASAKKDFQYLNMMNQWMIWKSMGKEIGEYFKQRGIKKIAIYGMSVYARHLIRELKDSNIKICFGMDQRRIEPYQSIYVFKPGEFQSSEVDAIVNTVIWDHQNIKKLLKRYYDCEIISLEDLIFEVV